MPLALLALLLAQQLPSVKRELPAPEQPVPFSHKQHAGTLRLKCSQCHPNPGAGDYMGIPKTVVCMQCHATVRKESPHVQKIAAAHEATGRLPWARVYRLPDYVLFNHKQHIERAAASCEACHGPVPEREVLRRERDISMASCIDCHRASNAKNACDTCHDPR